MSMMFLVAAADAFLGCAGVAEKASWAASLVKKSSPPPDGAAAPVEGADAVGASKPDDEPKSTANPSSAGAGAGAEWPLVGGPLIVTLPNEVANPLSAASA